MKLRAPLFFLLIVSSLLLQACGAGAEAAIATGIAQTQQISALETAAAGGGAPAVEGQPSDTPGPSVAFVSVTTDTHCRSGPRQDYSLLTTITIGQQVEVLKTFSNDYAVVKNPNSSGDCWLFLKFANTIDFSAFNLATATQPPTPKPPLVFNWDGSWVFYIGSSTQSVVVTQSGDQISGTFTYDGETATFSALLSSNHQLATGSYSTPSGYANTFKWQIKADNTDQFVGYLFVFAGDEAMCGSRAGAPMPNPCYGP